MLMLYGFSRSSYAHLFGAFCFPIVIWTRPPGFAVQVDFCLSTFYQSRSGISTIYSLIPIVQEPLNVTTLSSNLMFVFYSSGQVPASFLYANVTSIRILSDDYAHLIFGSITRYFLPSWTSSINPSIRSRTFVASVITRFPRLPDCLMHPFA
jgi:hypothetical protein